MRTGVTGKRRVRQPGRRELARGWPSTAKSPGPQGALYVPGPVTRKDGNELIILELGMAAGKAEFVSGPDLGSTEV